MSNSPSFNITDTVSQDMFSKNSLATPGLKPNQKLNNSSAEEKSSNLSDKISSVTSHIIQQSQPVSGSGNGNPSQKSWAIDSNSQSSLNQNQNNDDTEEENSPVLTIEKQKEKLTIQFELEKSMIDMKYTQQLGALEKQSKPNNPLTKRLLTKVQNEWNQAVQKKKVEFDSKMENMTDNLD